METDRRPLLAETACLAVLVKGLLRVASLRSILGFSRRIFPSPAPSPARVAPDPEALCRDVQAALRLIPLRVSCLERSLILHAILGRRKIPSSIKIGLKKDPPRGSLLAAHAWVEAGGKALLDEDGIRDSFHATLSP